MLEHTYLDQKLNYLVVGSLWHHCFPSYWPLKLKLCLFVASFHISTGMFSKSQPLLFKHLLSCPFIFRHFCCSERTADTSVLRALVSGAPVDELTWREVLSIVLKPESMWQMSNREALAVLTLDSETLQGIYCMIITDLQLQQSRWLRHKPFTGGNSWWHTGVFVIR